MKAVLEEEVKQKMGWSAKNCDSKRIGTRDYGAVLDEFPKVRYGLQGGSPITLSTHSPAALKQASIDAPRR